MYNLNDRVVTNKSIVVEAAIAMASHNEEVDEDAFYIHPEHMISQNIMSDEYLGSAAPIH